MKKIKEFFKDRRKRLAALIILLFLIGGGAAIGITSAMNANASAPDSKPGEKKTATVKSDKKEDAQLKVTAPGKKAGTKASAPVSKKNAGEKATASEKSGKNTPSASGQKNKNGERSTDSSASERSYSNNSGGRSSSGSGNTKAPVSTPAPQNDYTPAPASAPAPTSAPEPTSPPTTAKQLKRRWVVTKEAWDEPFTNYEQVEYWELSIFDKSGNFVEWKEFDSQSAAMNYGYSLAGTDLRPGNINNNYKDVPYTDYVHHEEEGYWEEYWE